jgi:DNA mismatch repair protein MSH5
VAKFHSVLQIRPAIEFRKEQGLSKIIDLRAPISSATRDEISAYPSVYNAPQHALSTLPLSVSAAHALLLHLERCASAHQDEYSSESQTTSRVTSIDIVVLSDTMHVSADTLRALCIFDEEDHAASHSQRGKEGLSLFGMLDCVQTPASRALLRRWLLFPSRSIATLNARFDAVGLLLGDKTLFDSLRREIKGVKTVERLSSRLLDGCADVATFKGISEFVSKCQIIRGHCASLGEKGTDVPIIDSIMTTFTSDRLRLVRNTIDDVIDWSESRLSQRIWVKTGLDAQMDEWRQVYTNLPAILHSIATKLKEELGTTLDTSYHLYVEYFPQVGYLQALCREDGRPTDESSIQVGEAMGWIYQYSSEIKAYFKTDETKDLDKQLGDLYSFIAGREVEIIQNLHERLAQHMNWLVACSQIVFEIDCLLAFAIVAEKHNYVRPAMEEGPILDICDGRHPMQELIVEAFIPNSTAIEGGRGEGVESDEERYNSITIITGANACGKSIYLKQCALIVYMAQVGSFVPARSATIGIVDKSEWCSV